MVTKIRINPGNCMMKAVVTVQKKSNERQNPGMEVDVCLVSECKNLDVFKVKFKTISMRTYPDIMKETILHCICPVPLGVVKACEMEMGIGLKKDITYEVIRE